MITTTQQMYEFVNKVLSGAREHGYEEIAARLDDAMHLGSSGLEICGAIGNVLKEERPRLEKVVSEKELQEAIDFVDSAFGRI
jgi:hypothetical protein